MTNLPPRKYYALRTPCVDCPFRSDKHFHMSTDRRTEIADGLEAGYEFVCHKTVDYSERPDDDDYTDDYTDNGTYGQDHATACAGARETLRRTAEDNPHVRPMTNTEQIMRRLGADIPDTNHEAPVFNSLDEWINNGD